MGRSNETSTKKDREKKKQRERKEKEEKKAERKGNKGKSFEDMIAYVDEFGRLTSTPPDPTRRVEMKIEDIQISVEKQLPPDPADLIRTGTVSFFNDEKGYGFIKDHETQESIFVHVSAIKEPIKEGNKVTFEVENGPKGPTAVRVKPSL
jgi:cold shock CspA family protein